MGCGASRCDINGIVLAGKHRPFFLTKLEDFGFRRHPHVPLTDSSSVHSKKELLLHDSKKDGRVSKDGRPSSFKSTAEEALDKEKVDKIKYELMDEEFEDVGEKDSDERAITKVCPSSPSFRVYVKDGDEGNSNDVSGDSFEGSVSSNEAFESNKKIVKKGRKMRSFKMVLPLAGQTAIMRNLLINVKSCYNSFPSTHHHSRLLTQGATA